MAVCAPALWLTPVPARSARELDRRVDSIPVNAERFLWPRGCPEARVMRAEPSPPSVPLRSARAAVWGPVYLCLLRLWRADKSRRTTVSQSNF